MATGTENPPTLTPADEGIIAATLDDCDRQGLGDDDRVDAVAAALVAEAGFDTAAAHRIAYRAVHAVHRPGWPTRLEQDR